MMIGSVLIAELSFSCAGVYLCVWIYSLKYEKGIWWMPWRIEAMKDVALCDKHRGGESIL